jgi:hypothetical protein
MDVKETRHENVDWKEMGAWAKSCEQSNEPSVSIKGKGCFDELHNS